MVIRHSIKELLAKSMVTRPMKCIVISTKMTYYLNNAKRKGTESVVEGLFFFNENRLWNSQFSGVSGRTYYLEMVGVYILNAIVNYGVVSNTI